MPARCESVNSYVKTAAPYLRREPLATEPDLVRVELIDNPLTIAECGSEILSQGGLFICHRCSDVNSCVVAILVLSEYPGECYALCRKCLRALPKGIDP